MKEQIYEYCKQLRLSTTFASNAISTTGNTNQEYMLEILKTEVEYRDTKRKNLHLKQAGFDNIKTFENYRFEDIEIPVSLTIDLLKHADFLSRTENLILYGRNGTGNYRKKNIIERNEF